MSGVLAPLKIRGLTQYKQYPTIPVTTHISPRPRNELPADVYIVRALLEGKRVKPQEAVLIFGQRCASEERGNGGECQDGDHPLYPLVYVFTRAKV